MQHPGEQVQEPSGPLTLSAPTPERIAQRTSAATALVRATSPYSRAHQPSMLKQLTQERHLYPTVVGIGKTSQLLDLTALPQVMRNQDMISEGSTSSMSMQPKMKYARGKEPSIWAQSEAPFASKAQEHQNLPETLNPTMNQYLTPPASYTSPKTCPQTSLSPPPSSQTPHEALHFLPPHQQKLLPAHHVPPQPPHLLPAHYVPPRQQQQLNANQSPHSSDRVAAALQRSREASAAIQWVQGGTERPHASAAAHVHGSSSSSSSSSTASLLHPPAQPSRQLTELTAMSHKGVEGSEVTGAAYFTSQCLSPPTEMLDQYTEGSTSISSYDSLWYSQPSAPPLPRDEITLHPKGCCLSSNTPCRDNKQQQQQLNSKHLPVTMLDGSYKKLRIEDTAIGTSHAADVGTIGTTSASSCSAPVLLCLGGGTPQSLDAAGRFGSSGSGFGSSGTGFGSIVISHHDCMGFSSSNAIASCMASGAQVPNSSCRHDAVQHLAAHSASCSLPKPSLFVQQGDLPPTLHHPARRPPLPNSWELTAASCGGSDDSDESRGNPRLSNSGDESPQEVSTGGSTAGSNSASGMRYKGGSCTSHGTTSDVSFATQLHPAAFSTSCFSPLASQGSSWGTLLDAEGGGLISSRGMQGSELSHIEEAARTSNCSRSSSAVFAAGGYAVRQGAVQVQAVQVQAAEMCDSSNIKSVTTGLRQWHMPLTSDCNDNETVTPISEIYECHFTPSPPQRPAVVLAAKIEQDAQADSLLHPSYAAAAAKAVQYEGEPLNVVARTDGVLSHGTIQQRQQDPWFRELADRAPAVAPTQQQQQRGRRVFMPQVLLQHVRERRMQLACLNQLAMAASSRLDTAH